LQFIETIVQIARYLALIFLMKSIITYSFCFVISAFLLGAQIGPSYDQFQDLVIELQDSGEENPVEDTTDIELEKEKDIREGQLSIDFDYLSKNRSLLHHEYSLQDPKRDILSPPPDTI